MTGVLVASTAPPSAGSKRAVAQRRVNACLQMQGLHGARDGGRSLLESHAVRGATAQLYSKLLAELWAFAKAAGLSSGSAEQDEIILLEWADAAFLEGRPAAGGQKMYAAYCDRFPARGRLGQPLARVRRSLTAWRRLVPAFGRIAPAFPMICGIVTELVRAGQRQMALATLVTMSAYLRPGEMHALRGCDMVRPLPQFGTEFVNWSIVLGATDADEPKPTKQLIYDDAVILDHHELSFLNELLEVQVAMHPGRMRLWDFDEVQFRSAFCRAAASAGLEHLHLVPHSLRHAGPSWDAMTGRRSQREIQRRGRWAASSSVVRYERSSKVASLLQELPARTQGYLQRCDQHLSSTLRGGRPPSMSGL